MIRCSTLVLKLSISVHYSVVHRYFVSTDTGIRHARLSRSGRLPGDHFGTEESIWDKALGSNQWLDNHARSHGRIHKPRNRAIALMSLAI
ncbi:hypothetical protein [Marinobacter sp. LV10MA510-1]|uniref:hypothetical protein n=1 Tax=Marinobacter sp. LV10MA510-1 TaxID=1415567 RepID=UPI0011806C53|nr:hypothetical protein [Marinobacter sp. LV10MA510-1]